jgi:glycerophosphoryl diester phosphodiesterase
MRMSRPLLLGHRGVRGLKSIPENTIAAFDRAIADGCDGFEFDVRMTRDGVPVIWHDEKVRLMRVAHTTGKKLSRLARLEDVLVRYRNSAFLDIELKVSGLERITADLLRKHPPARGYVVSSFFPQVLGALHAENSSIPLGLICEAPAQLDPWRSLSVEHLILHQKLATPEVIRELQETGKKVFVWTVNKAAAMRRFADLGIDGLISDKTALLCRTLKT